MPVSSGIVVVKNLLGHTSPIPVELRARMPLTIGTSIGPYEIAGQLGAGGMGEVYRARDKNLGREVAIKVLPDAFADDADRLARFEREAKVLASLNHPRIAHVYGLERTELSPGAHPVRALVMELVEGPTLADLEPAFQAGEPKMLFEVPSGTRAQSTDGNRFLLAVPTRRSTQVPFTVVQNWPALMNR